MDKQAMMQRLEEITACFFKTYPLNPELFTTRISKKGRFGILHNASRFETFYNVEQTKDNFKFHPVASAGHESLLVPVNCLVQPTLETDEDRAMVVAFFREAHPIYNGNSYEMTFDEDSHLVVQCTANSQRNVYAVYRSASKPEDFAFGILQDSITHVVGPRSDEIISRFLAQNTAFAPDDILISVTPIC